MKSDRIEHLCRMIAANVYHSYSANMDDSYGYLEQLKKLTADGGYASEGTMEELSLTRAVAELHILADEIAQVRTQLVTNTPPKLYAVDMK